MPAALMHSLRIIELLLAGVGAGALMLVAAIAVWVRAIDCATEEGCGPDCEHCQRATRLLHGDPNAPTPPGVLPAAELFIPTEDKHPDAPYGILCRQCGKQGLTRAQYQDQMTRPGEAWACPVCGQLGIWDDPRYDNENIDAIADIAEMDVQA